MKLAIIRQRYTPYGGAERFIERALSTLGSDDLDVTVIARDWPEDAQSDFQRLLVQPFSIGRTWRDAAFAHAACRVVANEGFDLVQSHERLPCCDIFRAGDGVHREWLIQRARLRGSWKSMGSRFSLFHRRLLNAEKAMFASPRLKHVICISRMVRDDVLRHYEIPEHKLSVIYNGLDLQAFHPGLRTLHRNRLRAELGLSKEAVVFLFVGSGFERKGVPMLLRLWPALPRHAHLVVIGYDRKADQYARLARKLGLEHRMHFVGPKQDVAPWYGLADVFAFPTIYEPFGNAPLEALASGVPVLTTRKCGASELIHPGVNGEILDAFDEVGWQQALLAWLKPDRQEAARPSARASAIPFTYAAMEQNFRHLYSTLKAA